MSDFCGDLMTQRYGDLGPGVYITLGECYTTLGLELVERLAAGSAYLAEVGGREPGDLFELAREMRYAAVAELVCYL